MTDIAIAGGGIAGLAAAVALRRSGFAITVFERTESPREVGAGIQLSPNALARLAWLDLTKRLAPALSFPQGIEVRNGRTGAVLTRIPLGEAAKQRYGSPYALIHRADLQAALLAEAEALGVALHFDAEVEHADADRNGVTFTAGGNELRCGLLVCADGVFSRLRTSAFGLPPARRLDKIAWRGTLDAAAAPTAIDQTVTGLWLGPGAHVVHYPVRAGAHLNVVLVSSALDESGALPVADFAAPVRDLAEAVPLWTPWPLNVIDDSGPWRRGRMVLIGDAAHAMAPSAAQGGAQAIEDACALAQSIGPAPGRDMESALAQFEASRRPRVKRIAREALRNLSIYNLVGLPALFRNQVITAIPPRIHQRRLDWIYRYPAEDFP